MLVVLNVWRLYSMIGIRTGRRESILTKKWHSNAVPNRPTSNLEPSGKLARRTIKSGIQQDLFLSFLRPAKLPQPVSIGGHTIRAWQRFRQLSGEEYMIDAGRAWLQKSELLTIWNDSAAFVRDGELWCDQVSKTLVRAVTVTAWIAFLKTHIEAPLRHGGSTSRWSEDLDVLASRPGLLFNFPFYLPNKDIVSQEAVF